MHVLKYPYNEAILVLLYADLQNLVVDIFYLFTSSICIFPLPDVSGIPSDAAPTLGGVEDTTGPKSRGTRPTNLGHKVIYQQQGNQACLFVCLPPTRPSLPAHSELDIQVP